MKQTVRLISSTFLLAGFFFLLADTPMAFAGKHDKKAKKDHKNARSPHDDRHREDPNRELADFARDALQRYRHSGLAAFGSGEQEEKEARTTTLLRQLKMKLLHQELQECFSQLLERIEQMLQGNLPIRSSDLLEQTLEEFLAVPGADMTLLLQIQDAILGHTDPAMPAPAFNGFLNFHS